MNEKRFLGLCGFENPRRQTKMHEKSLKNSVKSVKLRVQNLENLRVLCV